MLTYILRCNQMEYNALSSKREYIEDLRLNIVIGDYANGRVVIKCSTSDDEVFKDILESLSIRATRLMLWVE